VLNTVSWPLVGQIIAAAGGAAAAAGLLWKIYIDKSAERRKLSVSVDVEPEARNGEVRLLFHIANAGKPSVTICEIGGKHEERGLYFVRMAAPENLLFSEKHSVAFDPCGDLNWKWFAVRDSLEKTHKAERSITYDTLVKRLEDSDQKVKLAAIAALKEWPHKSALRGLLKLLHNNKEKKLQEALVVVLGKIGDASAIPQLLEVVHGEDRDLPRAAVDALGRIGGPDAVRELIKILNDEAGDSDLRIAAIRALGRTGNSDAMKSLMKILKDQCDRGDLKSVPACVEAVDALRNIQRNPDLKKEVEDFLKDIEEKIASPEVRYRIEGKRYEKHPNFHPPPQKRF